MINWIEYWERILGTMNVTELFVYLTFFIVGVIIYSTIDIRHSVKSNASTPKKFKFWFMIKDNFLRWIGGIFLFFVVIRFYDKISGHPITEFDALSLGINIDLLISILKKGGQQFGPVKRYREQMIKKFNGG